MQTLHEKWQAKGLRLISVNTHADPMHTGIVVKSIKTQHDISFPVAYGGAGLMAALGELDLPLTLIFDGQGRLRFRHQGFEPGMEHSFEREIRLLLNGDKS